MTKQGWILLGLALLSCRASFYFLKRLCLLILLWGIAYVDLKEYRIPNKAILAGVLGKALIIILEIFFDSFALGELTVEIFAALILLLGSLGCRLIIKNSIGAGDVKLLVIMAFFLEWKEIWEVVFLSLIVFLIVAVVLLITKRKARGDYIPLGPAFAIGTSIVFLF